MAEVTIRKDTNEVSQPDETSLETQALSVSRRSFLGAGSAAFALTALTASRAEAQAPGNVHQAEHDQSSSNPGPENRPVAAQEPDANTPPPTDKGDVPTFWYSFSLARKRVEEGGWARQVNIKDLPLATEIAAVNMRLTAGGVRELHWHAAAEWSLMLKGNARLTAIDDKGKSYVNDVTEGDLWYFPTGVPHSIQGLGPDGCEFLLVFDDGRFSEFDTTLISDWLARTPKSVLAKNWGVSEAALEKMPKEELYIFQGRPPASLEDRSPRCAERSRALSRLLRFQDAHHAAHPQKPARRSAHRGHPQLPRSRSPSPWPTSSSSPAPCASSTGTPTPTSGSTTSRAGAA